MPVGSGKRFDFQVDGKGYILARQQGARSWHRTGISDAPSRRSDTDAKYGVLPDEIDHPTVFDDWSGGYGHPYRRTGENTYHWAENFDARSPRQLVHAQNPQLASATFSTSEITLLANVDEVIDASPVSKPVDEGAGSVILLSKAGYGVHSPYAGGFHELYALRQLGTVNLVQLLHPAAVYGSYLYFGDSRGSAFWRVDAAGGYTTSSDPGFRFVVAGNTLWRSHGPTLARHNYLQHCANPAGVMSMTNWSATYNIGNYAGGIKDMVSLDDQVVVGMGDGLFVGDSTGTFVNVMSDLAHQVHPDNCRDLTVWNNSVIAPHIAGVFAYNTNGYTAQVEDMSPPRADRSPATGRIRSVRGYGRYLYAGLYTGSQSWLLSGERNGPKMIWHTLQRMPHQAKVSRIHIDGITTASGGVRLPNRMYMAMDASIDTAGTAPLYWWPIPSLDGNPLSPSPAFSANYIGSARMDLGSVDWGSPSTPKQFRSVEITADNLASGAQWCNVYQTVDNGVRALLGTVAKSPKDTLYFSTAGIEETTNIVLNPSAEAVGNFAAAGTATVTRVTTNAYKGSNSYRIQATAGGGEGIVLTTSVMANSAYYVSFYALGDIPELGWFVYGGALVTPVTATLLTTDGLWGRYGCLIPASEANGYSAIRIVQAQSEGEVTDYLVDAIQVELKGSATLYADGSLPSCAWSSTAHASSSTRTAYGFITGQAIELSLESFTASPAITPIYRSVVLRGALRPNSVDEITAVVQLADGMHDRQGGPMRSAATMISELRALASAAAPVTLIDLTGASSFVNVLGNPHEQELWQDGEDAPEVMATIKMSVMQFE